MPEAEKPELEETPPVVAELRKASDHLKAKIAEAKSRNDMPIDSALGDPHWEKNAADGHLDVPDEDDDDDPKS